MKTVRIAVLCVGSLCIGVAINHSESVASPSDETALRISAGMDGLEVKGSSLAFRERVAGGDTGAPARALSSPTARERGQVKEYDVLDTSGRAIDTVIDRTVEPKQGKQSRLGWMRSDRSLGIEWPAVPGVDKWKVETPTGHQVTTTKTRYIEHSNEGGTFLVSGINSRGNDKSYVLTIPSGAKSGDSSADRMSAGSAAVDQWRGVGWNSFIAEEYVEGKAFGINVCKEKDKYIYYGGDDRSWVDRIDDTYSGSEPRFRVGSLVASMWRGQAWVNPSFYDGYIGKVTGLTRAYNSDHELVATKRASAESGIDLVRGGSEILPEPIGGMGLATRNVEMSVADPLCTPRVVGGEAPSIDVEYTYRHTSNGYVSLNATHDKAPMHEVFGVSSDDEGDPSKSSSCLYRYENRGLNYLVSVPGVTRVDVTLDFNPDAETPRCVTDEK